MINPETIIDGRYRVISRVGSGGMADVYLAQDQLLGREVAVKVLHHHFAEDQEFVERFKREASSAATLSHPNIVGIFDRGEWDGTYYIAMEYVAGRSLKTIVRESGPLEPGAAIDIVVQILRAAQFAHRRGVIHRDLKPHNVIIDDDGRARVTDFGIARAGASDMTLTGSIMGTAQYLSPEQAQGFAVSDSSDIYSVGVILYELLTGVVPFEGETAVAIAFKQVSAMPRAPSELNPALPRSLDAVVLRALAKEPAQRYRDAAEMIATLEGARHALPALSGAALLAGAGALSGGVVASAAGPPTSVLVAPAGRFEEEYPPVPPDGHPRRRWLIWAVLGALIAAGAVAALLLVSPASKVAVPSVVGQAEGVAAARIRDAGLTPSSSSTASGSVPKGRVISQSPSAGARVAKSSRVALLISSGPSTEPVTNVEGLSEAAALARLRRAGFRPSSKPQASSTVASGRVLGSDPAAGTPLAPGSPVTVLVSSGPAPVRVPDVKGQSQSAAEATLTNAGLTVGSVSKRTSSAQPPGTVVAQTPASGSSTHAGGSVDLVVAEASQQATVPNVVGKGEALAAAALGSAGFTPRTSTTPTTDPSKVGVVLSQSPAGGHSARKGASVTIVLGVAAPTTTTTTTPTTTTPTSTTPAPAPTG
jgi:serine/threonine-protein kinase